MLIHDIIQLSAYIATAPIATDFEPLDQRYEFRLLALTDRGPVTIACVEGNQRRVLIDLAARLRKHGLADGIGLRIDRRSNRGWLVVWPD